MCSSLFFIIIITLIGAFTIVGSAFTGKTSKVITLSSLILCLLFIIISAYKIHTAKSEVLSETYYIYIEGYDEFCRSGGANTCNVQTYDAWNPTITFKKEDGKMYILNAEEYKTIPSSELDTDYLLIKEVKGNERTFWVPARKETTWKLIVRVD